MHQKAEVPLKSKGGLKGNSFPMCLHMAVWKTESDKTSFICKAKSTAALPVQSHPAQQDLQSGTANIFMLLPDLWQLLLESALTDSPEQLRNLSTASQQTV